MSEFIINLIILLVIIISVLKRISEVSQKSKELSKEHPEKHWDDLLEEGKIGKPLLDMPTDDGTIETVSRVDTPVFEEEPVMDYGIDETVPVETTIDVAEHRTDDLSRETAITRLSAGSKLERLQEEQRELAEKLKRVTAERVRERHRTEITNREMPSVANLSFSRGNVITGIVMSEILGPPVSMRPSVNNW